MTATAVRSRFDRDPAAAPAGRQYEHTPGPTPADYTRGLAAILDTLAGPARPVTCAACGCLCLPDEVCPGCRAARDTSRCPS